MTFLACNHIDQSGLVPGSCACRLNGKTVHCLGFYSRCECPELRHVRDRWRSEAAAERLGVRR